MVLEHEQETAGWSVFDLMVSDKNEQWKQFGRELKRRRLAHGYRFAKDFAPEIGISNTYLSQLENGYSKDGRKATEPGDEVLAAISLKLDWPLVEIRALIGQIPPQELEVQAREDWRQTWRSMETKLEEMPQARVERIIGLWEEQLIPHYQLYRDFEEEARELQRIREQGGEYHMTRSESDDAQGGR